MIWIVTKYLVTAALIVLATELAKINDKLGAFIVALPIVTILAMIWLQIEGQPIQKIANHSWYTFWYVLPTLPMFLLFPAFLQKFHFWLALSLASLITLVIFTIFAYLLKQFGMDLFP